MAGMLSADEMSELEDTGGDQFQDVWLEMMIDHRRGAIEMAETEQDDGTFKPVIKLAESIEKSQEAEIDKMEQLLDS